MGVEEHNVLVVLRPPARDALYHRFDNSLFDEMLRLFESREDVKTILLPRTAEQREEYERRAHKNMILPRKALNGANLIAAADLVVSAGGTMNREAAALGVPAATIYAGRWAAIDEELVREGRLQRLASREDLDALKLEKKSGLRLRRALRVRDEVTDLILSE
jgi:predicted glycosyltransferase